MFAPFCRHGLRHHMKSAHGERPKCPICFKPFKNQKYLEVHLRTHLGSDFVCKTCGRTCADKKSLIQHEKCHENPKGRNHITCMKIAKQKNIGLFKNE
jgi:uncharacterized Zn-finger protein